MRKPRSGELSSVRGKSKKGSGWSRFASSIPGGTAQGLEERLQDRPQVSDFCLSLSHAALAGPDDAVGQSLQAIEPQLGLGETPVSPREVCFELRLLPEHELHGILDSLPFPFGHRCFLLAVGLIDSKVIYRSDCIVHLKWPCPATAN